MKELKKEEEFKKMIQMPIIDLERDILKSYRSGKNCQNEEIQRKMNLLGGKGDVSRTLPTEIDEILET